jgi:hypothetical protein
MKTANKVARLRFAHETMVLEAQIYLYVHYAHLPVNYRRDRLRLYVVLTVMLARK